MLLDIMQLVGQAWISISTPNAFSRRELSLEWRPMETPPAILLRLDYAQPKPAFPVFFQLETQNFTYDQNTIAHPPPKYGKKYPEAISEAVSWAI